MLLLLLLLYLSLPHSINIPSMHFVHLIFHLQIGRDQFFTHALSYARSYSRAKKCANWRRSQWKKTQNEWNNNNNSVLLQQRCGKSTMNELFSHLLFADSAKYWPYVMCRGFHSIFVFIKINIRANFSRLHIHTHARAHVNRRYDWFPCTVFGIFHSSPLKMLFTKQYYDLTSGTHIHTREHMHGIYLHSARITSRKILFYEFNTCQINSRCFCWYSSQNFEQQFFFTHGNKGGNGNSNSNSSSCNCGGGSR